MITLQAFATAFTIGALSYVAYCIWQGRKVSHIKAQAWEDDDNNPVNWYLKDPNKFKL